MAARKITFDPDCDKAVEALGGYKRLDPTLEAAWDGLMREPRGFPVVQTDWGSVRYIKTIAIQGVVPALVWLFSIDNQDNVTIFHVEEDTGY
jgi:hypothetical protein